MIQIIAQRAFGGSAKPVFVYTEPVLLVPALSTLFAKYNEVLANLPEAERVNLFYTLAHHTGTSGASKPQRTNGTFEYQTALAFDIDADPEDLESKPDTGRPLEYAAALAGILEVTPEAFTVIVSGNGIHLLLALKHPIRAVKYFDDERESYKEILGKLKGKLRDAGLGGAGDPKIFDGGRVLRLPGSRNVKPGKPETVCQLVQSSKHQVEIDLFKLSGLKAREKEALTPKEIARKYPAPDFAEMVRECQFVKWTYSHPEQVHEPQAFDLFSLLAPQLPDAQATTPWGQIGPKEFGKFVFDKATNSSSLKSEDFESKWKQAKEYGGRKCTTIHNSWIGGCEQCPHWGKIPTPLALKSKDHIGSQANGYWVFGQKGQHLHPAYEDLAKVYAEEQPYLVTEERRLMGFNGKFYREVTEARLKTWIEEKVNPSEPLRETMRNEFMHKVVAQGGTGLQSQDFFDLTTRGRLNADNGILEIASGRIKPHSPDLGFLYALPYAIDLASEGPERFLDWLGTITQDRADLMEAILDLMAYILWPNYDDHLFAYFIGVGANGKSTLIHLIQALVGIENYSTVGIQQLGSNRFAPAQLEGKLVNLSEESSGGGQEMDFESMNVIKTLCAGGTMMVERKGKDGFSFTNRAKLIFSANHAPKFRETGHAIQRRMLTIPFDHLIENPDANVEKDLLAEVPAIAAMLVRRIQENIAKNKGKFLVYRGGVEAEEAKKRVIHGQNTAVEWGSECIESSLEVGRDQYIRIDQAYGHYKLWCEENGFKHPLSRPAFGKVLKSMILTPAAGNDCAREGNAIFRVYRYTKFKEGVPNYGPELRQ